MRRIQFGLGVAIANLVVGFFLDYWMYTISIQYDLAKGWAVIASLIDVTLCILIYPLFFVILRYAVLRRPLSVKKAHLISVPSVLDNKKEPQNSVELTAAEKRLIDTIRELSEDKRDVACLTAELAVRGKMYRDLLTRLDEAADMAERIMGNGGR